MMSEPTDRRRFLGGLTAGAAVSSLVLSGCGRPADDADLAELGEAGAPVPRPDWWRRPSAPPGEHKLVDLPYAKDQLVLEDAADPKIKGISAQVVEWHHGKHHAGYVTALNSIEKQVAEMPEIEANGNYSTFTELKRRETFNASGMYLHDIYWQCMKPGGGEPSADLGVAAKLALDFGSLERWREEFIGTAKTPNTGWAILALAPYDGKLHNFACSFHDLGGVWGAVPLIACDVWEHAYYYDYGPEREDYIESFLRLLNWQRIDQWFRFAAERLPRA